MRFLFTLFALYLGAIPAFAEIGYPIISPSSVSVVTGGACVLNETVIGTPNATATTVSTSTGAISAPNQFIATQQIVFGATGLNAAYSAGTIYYVIAAGLTSSAFEVSATSGGSAIVPGTSTMTATAYPTWTPSATTNFVWITEVGGGSGGGGGNTTSGGGGGGGGPGWSILDYGTPVTAGSFLTLNIGVGGAAGGVASNGGAGGNTGISGAVFNVPMASSGGQGSHGAASLGGNGASGGNQALSGLASGGAGGSASAGGVGYATSLGAWFIAGTGGGGGGSTGGYAGGASRTVNGTTNTAGGTSTSLGGGGAGGSSAFGTGGAGGSDGGTGSAPSAGNYGAGGGGGATNTTGGAGMNGAVIIRWCS